MALNSICLVHRNGDMEIYGKHCKYKVKFIVKVKAFAREIGVKPTRKFVKRCSPNRHKEGIRFLCFSHDIINEMQKHICMVEKEIYNITMILEPLSK